MTRNPDLVAVVVANGAPIFETAVPLSVFGVDRTDTGGPAYSVLPVSADGQDAISTGGIALGRLRGLEEADQAGVVIVPTWPSPLDPPPERLVQALRACHSDGAIVVGLCLGAFVLAAAGLLDGRRATTHWAWAGVFSQRFPEVRLDPAVLYVDEGQVITSAGTAAGLDACLHLVRRERGARAAAAIARRMVVPPHRSGGQAQFIDSMDLGHVTAGPLGELLAWMVANLDQDITVEQLAARLNVSRRTFDRQFREVTGASPLRWLLHQRVIAAQQLLETTDLPVDHVARHVGFTSAISMRPHFHRTVGVSPAQYRQAFRAPKISRVLEQFSQLFVSQPAILKDLSVDTALQILIAMNRDSEEPAVWMLQDVVTSSDPLHCEAGLLERSDHHLPRRWHQAASWIVKVTIVRAEWGTPYCVTHPASASRRSVMASSGVRPTPFAPP
jgi:transcriptional regulator GlxA family with amidase domain